VRVRIATELVASDRWEVQAATQLLAGLSCRERFSLDTLALLVAHRFNPHHARYAGLVRSALAAGLDVFEPSSAGCEERQQILTRSARPVYEPLLMQIPKISLVAVIERRGLDSDSSMESPSHPQCVAWYRFTGRPGSAGSAVFAAHRDWWGAGPAAFWRLGQVCPGDFIELQTVAGPDLCYRVTDKRLFDASDVPVAEILGPGSGEWLTLLTCAGPCDRSTREYSARLMLRAERAAPRSERGPTTNDPRQDSR
jgi:sortase (surface protein transpeptidase)